MWQDINEKLAKLYNQKEAKAAVETLQSIVKDFQQSLKAIPQTQSDIIRRLTQKDIALISYANSIVDEKDERPSLNVLNDFLKDYQVDQSINTLHLLPFYPWDTDRGFSVKDYYTIHQDYGDWSDVEKLSESFNIMVDFVANHASIDNPLIQSALIEKHLDQSDSRYSTHAPYKDFVIIYTDKTKPTKQQLKALARPRPNPVLSLYTVFETKDKQLKAILGKPDSKQIYKILGQGWVWTTFSRTKADDGSETTRQVDLNFNNPAVLVESIKILLFYIQQHTSLIRLDAIGYIWKRLSSSSLHEPECHLILELIFDIINLAAPGTTTIAEVNEPQDKVFPYLGTKDNPESDLIYQFTHFPLAIYAVLTGDGDPYLQWFKTLNQAHGKQFITVLGSHDGLGLKPARGFLTEDQLDKMTQILVTKHKTLPNYASLPGGESIVYELCATPWNLINRPDSTDDFQIQLNRYLAVVALGLTVRGIPAFYINGLLGTINYLPQVGLDENRTINRQIFSVDWLHQEMNDGSSQISQIFKSVTQLLDIRRQEPAFNPTAPTPQPLTQNNKSIVSTYVPGTNDSDSIISIINVSSSKQQITIKSNQLPKLSQPFIDIVTRQKVTINNNKLNITLKPYQVMWTKNE